MPVMKERFGILAALAVLASCVSPPSRPESLWDSLPSPQAEAAKSLPAKVWDGAPVTPDQPGDSTSNAQGSEVVGTVVINEIFYDSADSDTDGNLFVELYGTPGLAIGGYKINFINGSDGKIDDSMTLPTGAKIREDGFILIADAKNGSPTDSNIPNPDLIDNFDPQNGPDAVQLVDSKGQLADAVGYGDGGGIVPVAQNGLSSFEGTPALDVASGHSLGRRQPGVDTDDNSADFVDRETPTPGGSPAVPEAPPPAGPVPSQVPPQDPPPPSTPPSPPTPPAKVVLNEIYYDAVGSDTDGVLFVELYGTPGADLAGDKINFINGDDGKIYDSITLSDASALPSDGFYVIADAKNGSSTETNVVGADFVDSFDPQNGPDSVQLLNRDGGLMDAVSYGAGVVPTAENGLATFETTPAIDVVNGHSLERKEPGFDSDDNSKDFFDSEAPTPGR